MTGAPATAVMDGVAAARDRHLRSGRRWARWWRARPAVAGLTARLDGIDGTDAAAAAGTLAAARPLLADIGWAEHGLRRLARIASLAPGFEPPLRAIRRDGQIGLVLFEHRLLRIAALRLPAPAEPRARHGSAGLRTIGFSGQASLLRVVRAGGAAIRLWGAAPAGPGFTLAGTPPCRRGERVALTDGMTIVVDGACRSWELIEAAEDVILLQAGARAGGAPFAVEYDAATGRPLAASASEGAVSRQQLLVTMLAGMGRGDALPTLAALAIDAPFALRWGAVRAAWELDPAAAWPLLRAMRDHDPHPEIRAAAGAALAA